MGEDKNVQGAAGGERTVDIAGGEQVSIGPLRPAHRRALFDLFAGVVERGEGFPHQAPLTEGDFDAAWGSGPTLVVEACHGDDLVGAYYLKANFPGRAGHIANAGYMAHPHWRGRGVGRALVEDSLVRARRLGFDALQFNLVFVSNPARRLYEELGFVVTGRVPAAVEGEDALVYWRQLGPALDQR